MRKIAVIIFGIQAGLNWPLYASDKSVEVSPSEVVMRYHQALINGNSTDLIDTLGSQIVMYNGAASTDPLNWQPHMFLSGNQVTEWAEFMTTGAGPHVNEVAVLNSSDRAGMSLVVTRETGGNKFLTWENDRFVYLLGQSSSGWEIVGLFLPEATNPE